MALVDVERWTVSLSFEDNNKKRSSMSVNIAGNLLFIGAENFLIGLRDRVTPLTNAKLTGGTITRNYTEDAPIVPPKESEVERKLVLPFKTGIPGHGATIEVPSHVFTIEQDGTDVPLLTTQALLDLQDLIVNGGVGFENAAVTVANVGITSADTPYSAHRARKPNRA